MSSHQGKEEEMFSKEELEEIQRKRKEWEEGTLAKTMQRFGVQESPHKFYTPADIEGHDFLEKGNFPGEYPFTSGAYAMASPMEGLKMAATGSLVRAGIYSGYGTAEDTREYYKMIQSKGFPGGPNIAFDLPTQTGLDSDDPRAKGEVGKVGVAVDTFADFETIFEAFSGPREIDKIASNFTVNATADVIIAMYAALADKRGIPLNKLRGTPQNDILKEIIARSTHIFPTKPSMRMSRDSIVYCTENMPLLNTINICGYHIREAGASREQCLGFTLANGIAYVQLGVDAGLDVDVFANRFAFLNFGGSMEILKEIAMVRAARRMWAKIMRERFGAKNPRNWILRLPNAVATIGCISTTAQRPLNNQTRATLGGVASALSGGTPIAFPPYDEPLGLGWSMEALQLTIDAMRIMAVEAKLTEVIDPFAGSYYMEAETDAIEAKAWEIIKEIDEMGGAVAAIDKGWMQRKIAENASEYQRQIETGERSVVGVNAFVGEQELEVMPQRLVPDAYDPKQRAEAEEKQLQKLAKVKAERDNAAVESSLKKLEEVARDESANVIPPLVECVKAYATLGEMIGTLKKVFGEHTEYGVL
jgi:methylmalonyl-CoA mutase N-terminal domain/subunit